MCMGSRREKHFEADKGFFSSCFSLSPSSKEACHALPCSGILPLLVSLRAFYLATRTAPFFFSPLLLYSQSVSHYWRWQTILPPSCPYHARFFENWQKSHPCFLWAGMLFLLRQQSTDSLYKRLGGTYFKLLDHMMLVATTQLCPYRHRKQLLDKQTGMAICQ